MLLDDPNEDRELLSSLDGGRVPARVLHLSDSLSPSTIIVLESSTSFRGRLEPGQIRTFCVLNTPQMFG
jgi:hypothetical protein